MTDTVAAEVVRLNAGYAVKGAIDFAERWGGPVAVLNSAGSSAVVALQGAQVLSFVPKGAREVLWLAPSARLGTGKSVRGGIPVCWPWFADHADPGKPAHGFVRAALWRVLGARSRDDAGHIKLGFDATGIDPALWPFRADVTLDVELAAASLKVTLTTISRGGTAIDLTEALHTYFAIGDISDISISGLENRAYIDQLDLVAKPVQAGSITFDAETDRIYYGTADTVVIGDSRLQRAIHIGKSGSDSTVVWNPWIEKSERLGDMGHQGYRRMVCVETCNAGPDVVTLAPGARHSLVQELSVSSIA